MPPLAQPGQSQVRGCPEATDRLQQESKQKDWKFEVCHSVAADRPLST